MASAEDTQIAPSEVAIDLYLDLLKRNLARWGEVKIVPLMGNDPFRRAVRTLFALRGLQVCQIKPFIAKLREVGQDWPDGPTVIGLRRLDNIQSCILAALREEVPGDLVDAGIWRGGASILMRAVLAAMGDSERLIWCADLSWNSGAQRGSSKRGAVTYPRVPYRTPPLDVVKANFERFSMLDARVRFVIGPFAETLATTPIQKVAVLRLDTDTFETTREVLVALYEKVSRKGFVIINDYGRVGGPVRCAVDEFRKENNICATILDVDGTGAYWRLPA